ncbi:MAG: glycosyltransferase family 4 protein [Bacteriovorax sp.]|nr:glycosyltransferase family 4 protein [Rhizobacter sp.]
MTLHIGIAAPIATADIAHLLDSQVAPLPRGYAGAPLLGTLIEELLRRGHRVSAFTLSSDLPLDDGSTVVLKGHNLTLYCCPMRPRAWPFNGSRVGRIVDLYAFERRGLERAIAHAKPDVVHAHWAYEFAWAALRSGLPHVVTCHDSPFVIARFQRDFRHGAYRWLRAGMAWHVLRQARHVTTVSPYMVAQIQPLCRAAVSVVPNPITERAFARPRIAQPGRQRVLMVANGWDVRKNGEAALRAFALLSESLPGAELQVFGHDHGEGESAHRWWQQIGLKGRVSFVGGVTHEQVLAAMAQADVFMHAALEESFGAVLAEALAIGTPVVAGAASGAVPWVVGDAGRLVDVTRPESIAAALRDLLTDAAESSRLGHVGSERVRSMFSAEAVTAAYEHAYEIAQSGRLRSIGNPA